MFLAFGPAHPETVRETARHNYEELARRIHLPFPDSEVDGLGTSLFSLPLRWLIGRQRRGVNPTVDGSIFRRCFNELDNSQKNSGVLMAPLLDLAPVDFVQTEVSRLLHLVLTTSTSAALYEELMGAFIRQCRFAVGQTSKFSSADLGNGISWAKITTRCFSHHISRQPELSSQVFWR